MSDLQEIGAQVTAVAKDMVAHAQALFGMSQRLRQAAAQAASASRNAEGDTRAAMQAATALDAAADHCARAAQFLQSGKTAAELFVTRTVGGAAGGGVTPGRNAGGGGARDPGTCQSVEQVGEWLPSINPGYTGDYSDLRSANCGQCALAVFNRLNGVEGTAGLGTLTTQEMEAATGRKQVPTSPAEIERLLVQAGPGSHAVVGIDRLGWQGHWFNAYYDGKSVVAIDGQDGTIHDWPPDFGSTYPVTSWDVGV